MSDEIKTEKPSRGVILTKPVLEALTRMTDFAVVVGSMAGMGKVMDGAQLAFPELNKKEWKAMLKAQQWAHEEQARREARKAAKPADAVTADVAPDQAPAA